MEHSGETSGEIGGSSQAEQSLRELESQLLDQPVDEQTNRVVAARLAGEIMEFMANGRGIIRLADDDYRSTELVIDADTSPKYFHDAMAGITRVEVMQSYSLDRTSDEAEPAYEVTVMAGVTRQFRYGFRAGQPMTLALITHDEHGVEQSQPALITNRHVGFVSEIVAMAEVASREAPEADVEGSHDSLIPDIAVLPVEEG